jgi:hypothetical protein
LQQYQYHQLDLIESVMEEFQLISAYVVDLVAFTLLVGIVYHGMMADGIEFE